MISIFIYSIYQEIIHLRTEIKQKEELLSKISEKVANWSRTMDDLQRKQQTEVDISNGTANIPNS